MLEISWSCIFFSQASNLRKSKQKDSWENTPSIFRGVFAGWEVEDERDESLLQIQESGTPPGPDLSNEKFGLGGWLEGMIGHEIVPSYTKLYRNYYNKKM